jgi:hypothetical protein
MKQPPKLYFQLFGTPMLSAEQDETSRTYYEFEQTSRDEFLLYMALHLGEVVQKEGVEKEMNWGKMIEHSLTPSSNLASISISSLI